MINLHRKLITVRWKEDDAKCKKSVQLKSELWEKFIFITANFVEPPSNEIGATSPSCYINLAGFLQTGRKT